MGVTLVLQFEYVFADHRHKSNQLRTCSVEQGLWKDTHMPDAASSIGKECACVDYGQGLQITTFTGLILPQVLSTTY